MKYLFIEKHAVHYPVRQLCQALGVGSRGAGDHCWLAVRTAANNAPGIVAGGLDLAVGGVVSHGHS